MRRVDDSGEPIGKKGATHYAIQEIRRLILGEVFLAGEHLRQEDLSGRLKISRVPVREALVALAETGIVEHRGNEGFFVPKVRIEALHEIYLMRKLLETELLAELEWPSTQELDDLRSLAGSIGEAFSEGDMSTAVHLNTQFHVAIFRFSRLQLVAREVERLWEMSAVYIPMFIQHSQMQARVVSDHKKIISAIERKDATKLVKAMDEHRGGAEGRLRDLVHGRAFTSAASRA